MVDVLITGGVGFIGSHLAEAFIEDGHRVTVIDNLDRTYDTAIKKRNIALLTNLTTTSSGEFEFVEGNIRDEVLLEKHVSHADYVYHEAAKAGVGPSVDSPHAYLETNVAGTLDVLQAAADADVERVINASSSSVYGDVHQVPIPEHHPTKPASPYGLTKLATEHYCRLFTELHGLPTVSLRYFTVYGPRMRTGMAVPDFTARAVDDDATFTCFGDGAQVRDFTYVDDVVEANRQLMHTSVADGEVLNIGSGGTVSVSGLIDLVQDAVGVEKEVTHLSSRAGDAELTHADLRKTKRLIGYSPETPIDEGIEKFVSWYRDNEDWYHDLALAEALSHE